MKLSSQRLFSEQNLQLLFHNMSIAQSPDSRRGTGERSRGNQVPFTPQLTKMPITSSARFGALSHHSFFSRHNPHPHRVRHIQGLNGRPVCMVRDDWFVTSSLFPHPLLKSHVLRKATDPSFPLPLAQNRHGLGGTKNKPALLSETWRDELKELAVKITLSSQAQKDKKESMFLSLYFRTNLGKNLFAERPNIQLKLGESFLHPPSLPNADPVPCPWCILSSSMIKNLWCWSYCVRSCKLIPCPPSSSGSCLQAKEDPDDIIREKDLVMGMIKQALDGVDLSSYHQQNQLQAFHPGAFPPLYGSSFDQSWRKPQKNSSYKQNQAYSDDKPGVSLMQVPDKTKSADTISFFHHAVCFWKHGSREGNADGESVGTVRLFLCNEPVTCQARGEEQTKHQMYTWTGDFTDNMLPAVVKLCCGISYPHLRSMAGLQRAAVAVIGQEIAHLQRWGQIQHNTRTQAGFKFNETRPEDFKPVPSKGDQQYYVQHGQEAMRVALSMLEEKQGWKVEIKESNGDVICSKMMPGARKVFRLEAVLEASVDELYDLLFVRVEEMHEWNPSIQRIKILKHVGPETNCHSRGFGRDDGKSNWPKGFPECQAQLQTKIQHLSWRSSDSAGVLPTSGRLCESDSHQSTIQGSDQNNVVPRAGCQSPLSIRLYPEHSWISPGTSADISRGAPPEADRVCAPPTLQQHPVITHRGEGGGTVTAWVLDKMLPFQQEQRRCLEVTLSSRAGRDRQVPVWQEEAGS
ncbi:hypothetical protein L3Q82_010284 [Scortum barcoo]|uniref:Uncharacterized protein n=1 Tax=Scortum barcoo TaxID=214431 RepID=A0ACB8WBR7_9TELE|nr:hypothetical protein L3Q82_010284 [Scortum barcoo]